MIKKTPFPLLPPVKKKAKRKSQMQSTMINRMIGSGFLFLLLFAQAHAQTDPSTALGAGPLPSWNDGAAKKAIVEFVKTTTEKGSPQFVAPEARIATFDQALYDEAKKKGWTVISMKNDWKTIFSFDNK